MGLEDNSETLKIQWWIKRARTQHCHVSRTICSPIYLWNWLACSMHISRGFGRFRWTLWLRCPHFITVPETVVGYYPDVAMADLVEDFMSQQFPVLVIYFLGWGFKYIETLFVSCKSKYYSHRTIRAPTFFNRCEFISSLSLRCIPRTSSRWGEAIPPLAEWTSWCSMWWPINLLSFRGTKGQCQFRDFIPV